VDGSGRVPASARLFSTDAPVLIATTAAAPEARVREWQSTGAEVVVAERDVDGRVSLDAVVDALGKRDVQGLLVEGGATLAWSFVRDRLVDRVVQYLAPSLIGGVAAPGILGGGGFAPLLAAESLTFTRVDRIGPDLRVEADVHRDH
jgi:diaminohydroxyphosphoribosylaminopyrimidine deaminase/5-amino-6-(5-phosphoribosylamino)uracil reductase